MARNTNNPLLKGLTGMIGGWVFKQLRGKTVVTKRPEKTKQRASSPGQQKTRDRFREATVYAHAAMKNETKKAYYTRKAKKLKLPNAYTAAITDFMRKARVANIDTRRYTGKAGGEIEILVHKKSFELAEVKVTLTTKSGDLIEEGLATSSHAYTWTYRNRMPALKEGVVMIIDARDAIGNTTQVVHGEKTTTSYSWNNHAARRKAA